MRPVQISSGDVCLSLQEWACSVMRLMSHPTEDKEYEVWREIDFVSHRNDVYNFLSA